MDNSFTLVISTLPLPTLYDVERIEKYKNSFYLGFGAGLYWILTSDFIRGEETFAQFSVPYDRGGVKFILRYSVRDGPGQVAEEI